MTNEVFEKELILAFTAASILFLLLVFFMFSFVLIYQKKKQKHYQQIRELEYQYSESLLSSQIEIQENTLRDISQELHDNISQQLGLVKLQLNRIQMQGEISGITETKAVVSQTIEDLRNLSHSLHPDRIEAFSLKENLEFELEKINKLGNLTLEANIESDAGNLGKDKKIILFRIVQELLNNFLKHAQASYLGINIQYTLNDVQLMIEDNGRGLNPDQPAGIGLISIKNRLDLLKGKMEMENLPEKGLKISIKVPL